MSALQSFDASSEILAQTRAEFEASRKQIFFVDSSVPGYETLVTGLSESGKVFTIDANSNALAQIASALESVGGNVDGVHIYSHGRDGALLLGGQWIDTAAVNNSANILNRIGNALTANADVLLYGCNVAKSSVGQSFMERVAALTRADVAASSDVTGNANNWNLEKNAGAIETAPIIPTGWEAVLDATAQWGIIKADGSADADGSPQTSYTGFVSNDIVHVTGEGLTVDGGQGNDIYYVDNKSGVVTINEGAQSGEDTVITRVQNFTLNGGAQVETILLDDSKLTDKVGQSAKGNQYTRMITGNALDNNLTAGSSRGGVTLQAGDGNDYLDDGDGTLDEYATMKANVMASTLVGGKGDDNYIVHHEKDVITELANQGTDHVFSATERYTLAANVENLTLLQAQSTGVGNAMNNVLKSTQGNSSLDGQAGNDTLYASQAGNDTLNGGAGNDAYYVYGTDNSIVDSAGTDSVYSTVDFDLGADNVSGVEQLFLQGDATKATGNKLNNRLVGNESANSTLDGVAGNNTLEGGYGDDLFIIRSSNDMVIDKGGDNTIETHATVDLNRFGNATVARVDVQENTTTATSNNINVTAKRDVATSITGNSGNNVLTGGNMDDTLDAGTGGTNRLVGGLGDDVYYVHNATDTVVENANQGTDEVIASVNYTLAANVENLTLHDGAKSGTGNNLSNVIDASAVSGVILHGGVNTAGLQGDTFKVANGGNQVYSYNANDKFEGLTASDVLYVSYVVNGGDTMSNDTWIEYFSERGRNIGGATVIYRGNPVGTAGSGVSLTATGNATNLVGTDRADTLSADVAATLDGGKGGDSMHGSSQGDVFYVDSVGANAVANTSLRGNLGDIVDGGSDSEEDIDTIRSTVNIDLNKTYSINNTGEKDVSQYRNIEVVELQGTAGLTAKGYADRATTLIGNSGNNQLIGGTGDDVLDGGAGADVMTGGIGNDVYYIDNTGDRVVEQAFITNPDRSTVSGGKDSIYSNGININLASGNHANVEYVENIGDKGISMLGGGNGTTTTLDEEFHAGAYGDTIDGKGGKDVIYGGAGNDRIFTYGDDIIHTQNDEKHQNVYGGDDTLVIAKTVSMVGAVDLNDFSMIEAENFTSLVSNNVELKVSQGAREHIFSTGAGNDSIVFGVANDSDTMPFGESGIVAKNSKGQFANVKVTGFDIYTGGNGNDTLDASKRTEGIALAGGLGADQLLGGSGSDTLIADGGNDIITTGEGHDVVKITQSAVGSSITIRDFDALMDSVNDSELKGWTRTISQSGANCTIVWTNPEVTNQRITAVFQNTVGLDIKFGESKVLASGNFTAATDGGNPNIPYEITASGSGQSIIGGNSNDVLKSTGSGNLLQGGAGDDQLSGGNGDTLSGGAGNDVISLNNVQGSLSVDGGADNDNILLNSVAAGTRVTLAGGAGQDTLTLGSKAKVTLEGGGIVTSIVMNDETLNVDDGSGFESIVGSGDNDIINASQVNAGTTVTYHTNGGNDTYIGGAGNDVVHLHNLDASSKVSLSGGEGTDEVRFANQTITMTIGDSVTIGESTIEGFESFVMGSANDSITANIAKLAGKKLDGGSGVDTLKVNAAEGRGLYLELDGEGDVFSLANYGGDTPDDTSKDPKVATTITGVEAFDGSGNSKNYFDASTYTVKGSTLELTGGAGHDMFYLGGVTDNGKVTLSGGDGDDRFHLGDVAVGSTVFVDGGTDGVEGDRLHFNTYQDVSLVLNDKGNIGSVSLGGTLGEARPKTGTKVNITSNGLDGYYGGFHDDILDARNVKTIDNADGRLVLKGSNEDSGRLDGNDTLYASNSSAIKSELHAGMGWDYLVGSGGNDLFYLGNAEGTINDGADSIYTGAGRDTIVVNAQATATSTYITNFDPALDTLDDNALREKGWNRTCEYDASKRYVVVTYRGKDKVGNDSYFYLHFTNQTNANFLPSLVQAGSGVTDYSSYVTKMEIAGTDGNDSILGGSGATTIYGNGGADTILAGSGNDSIVVGKTVDDRLLVTESGIVVSGGIGDDNIKVGDIELTNPLAEGQDGVDVAIFGRTEEPTTLTNFSDNDKITVGTISSAGRIRIDGNGGKNDITVEKIGGNANTHVKIVTGDNDDVIRVNAVTNGSLMVNGHGGNDAFYLGHVSNNWVQVLGGDGKDTLTFIGSDSQGVNMKLVSESVSLNGAITLEGIDHIEGTKYGDSLDASRYNANNGGYYTLHGGEGNDTLVGGKDKDVFLSGGKGDDLLLVTGVNNVRVRGGDDSDTLSLERLDGVTRVTLSANGVQTDGGTIAFATENGSNDNSFGAFEMFRFKNQTVVANANYGGRLDFSQGNNTLVLGDGLVNGSKLTITGADANDRLDFNGWQLKSQNVAADGQVTATYTKSGKTITVLSNCVMPTDYSTVSGGKTYTLMNGSTLTAGAGADTFNVSLGGTAVALDAGGSSSDGRDRVNVSVTGSSTGNELVTHRLEDETRSYGQFYVQGSGAQLTFDAVTTGNGESLAGLTKVKANNNTAELTAYGWAVYGGTSGADVVDARNITATDAHPETWSDSKYSSAQVSRYGVHYRTGGGADTFYGGAGDDRVGVDVGSVVKGMSLDGGAGENVLDFAIEGNANDKTAYYTKIDGNGDIGELRVGSMTSATVDASITNFKTYNFQKGQDTVDISGYVTGSNGERLRIRTGGGNDSIFFTGDAQSGGQIIINAGDGDDILDMGRDAPGVRQLWLDGGAGNDTYKLRADAHSMDIADSDGQETIEIRGVHDDFDLSQVRFRYEFDEENGYTLCIANVRGGAALLEDNAGPGDANVLRFRGASTTGNDTLKLFDESGHLVAEVKIDDVLAQLTTSDGYHGQWATMNYTSSGATKKVVGIGSTIENPEDTGPKIQGSSGDDLITLENMDASEVYVHVDGGTGNDTITLGNVKDSNVILQGSAGSDSISVKSIVETKSMGDHEFFIYCDDTAGGTSLDGDDRVTIGSIDNALVRIEGGNGADQFYLGEIKNDAKIYLDGGNNPKSEPGGEHHFDELHFTGNEGLNLVIDDNVENGTEISPDANLLIRSIEAIEGTAQNDHIDASAMDAALLDDARKWQTIIDGGDGKDEIRGGASLQLRGGSGDDLLVVTGLSTEHDVWVRGDEDSDALSLEMLATQGFTLQGGFSSGNGEGTTAGLYSTDGNIVLDDRIETITLGAVGNNLTWNTTYSTTLTFNEYAANSLTLLERAAGSQIVIENCGEDDAIFDGALINNGWTKDITSDENDTKVVWKKDGYADITVEFSKVSADDVIDSTVPADTPAPNPAGTPTEVTTPFNKSDSTESHNLRVKADGLLVQTGSGDDAIAFDLDQGCTVEAGEGKDVIEVFGVDASVLLGEGKTIALDWRFYDDNGKTRLDVGLSTGLPGMNAGVLNFQTSGKADGHSEFAGDTVNLYGEGNSLLASFDLQSVLNASIADNNSASGSLYLNEAGADKKFS